MTDPIAALAQLDADAAAASPDVLALRGETGVMAAVDWSDLLPTEVLAAWPALTARERMIAYSVACRASYEMWQREMGDDL